MFKDQEVRARRVSKSLYKAHLDALKALLG